MERFDVIMPQMGESVAQGTITKWLKKIGDPVAQDEPLFEISTDKVDSEIPAPVSGYLAEILVQEGETVEIDTKVAVITSEPAGAADAASEGGRQGEARADTTAGRSVGEPGRSDEGALKKEAVVPEPAVAQEAVSPAGDDSVAEVRRKRSSPLVRKIAAEHGIDISAIRGTGLSGRVTKQDILAYIEKQNAARSAPRGRDVSPEVRVGVPEVPAQGVVPEQYLATPGPGDDLQPMSPMRKLIAEHMVWSKRISAHVATFLEVDMTRIVRLRAARKDEFLERTGVKLTYLPFIMQATLSALRAYPECNASVVGDSILYHKDVHLGMAVAIDKGLIVPVIRHADEKSFLGLARALDDVATRARSKKLLPDEVRGGTFSITNYGSFGSLGGTPVINQPQVAILGVGAIAKRPWVVQGPDGDAIAIRHIMMLSLSYDHRIVDGAAGSLFLDHVKRYLEAYDEARMG